MTLIGVWLIGDAQKLSYYVMNDSPGGLVYCAIIQSAIDVSILLQTIVWKGKSEKKEVEEETKKKA